VISPANILAGGCLLVSGSGALDIDGPNGFMRELANGLARRGITTVRMSKRPVLGNQGLHSFELEYLEPLSALLDELRKQRDDLCSVVLLGHSLGGHVAPLLANRLANIVGMAILNSPMRSLYEILSWQLSTLNLTPPDVALAYLAENDPHLAVYLGRSASYDPSQYLKTLCVPTLCISCGRDPLLPAEEFSRWKEALAEAGNSMEWRFYEDLNHLCMRQSVSGFNGMLEPCEIDPMILDEVSDWILHVLAGAMSG
jgi:pimeloyl-ACP methyl ester carboxylesterase